MFCKSKLIGGFSKRLLLAVLLIFLLFASCSSEQSYGESVKKGQDSVFVCISPKAYSYHNHMCRGLDNCDHDIKKVSLAEAKSMNRKPCGYCY